MFDVLEKDSVTPPIPTEGASLLERKPEPQDKESPILPIPNRQETSEPEGVACLGELVIVQRQLLPAPPGFTRSWADNCNPPPRGCSLTGQYTPGHLAGSGLLGVHAGNSLPTPP